MRSKKIFKKIFWLIILFTAFQSNIALAATDTVYVCTCKSEGAFSKEKKEVSTCETKEGVFPECASYCGGKEKVESCLLKEAPKTTQTNTKTTTTETPKTEEENKSAQFTPQISIPNSEFQQGTAVNVGHASGTKVTSDLIGRYIVSFYKWGLTIGGVLAVLMLMAGGLIWLTSAGDSGKIGDAKKMISGSLLGTLLLVGAYFFLHTINPDLIKMPAITMDTVNKTALLSNGCCEMVKNSTKADMTISSNCEKGYFYQDKILNYTTGKCETPVCCLKEQVTTYGGKTYKSLVCTDILMTKCNEMKASSPKNDQYITYNYTYLNASCSTYSKCTTENNGVKPISNELCIGKDNGETVTGGGYCYAEKIYLGSGDIGEPCGDENFSKCDPDEDQDGESCNGDLGARDCKSGLWCCKFDSSGKRIN